MRIREDALTMSLLYRRAYPNPFSKVHKRMWLLDNKAIFVHVPRTGGAFGRSGLAEAGVPFKEIGSLHSPLGYTDDLMQYPDLFTFGFVRNPLAWQLSVYLRFEYGEQTREAFTHYLMNTDFITEQQVYDYIYAVPPSKIYKTEELQSAWNEIYDRFGWTKPKTLLTMKEVNRSSLLNIDDFYTEEMAALVKSRNSKLIDRYYNEESK